MKQTSTVIICTRNRPDDIQTCLASLQKQTVQPDQLIIVDSSDLTFEMTDYVPVHLNECNDIHSKGDCASARQQYLACMVNASAIPARCETSSNVPELPTSIYIHTKPGLTHQRNVGIEHATGHVIYFFDDDVVLQKDYLAQMQKAFADHPEYGGGMGSIENMQPYVADKYRLLQQFFLLPRDYSTGMFRWSGMPTHAYGTSKFKPVEVLGGCCMAFKKEALCAHQFDESFGGYAYMEDVDISWRVSRDFPLFYNPKAQLQHHNSPVSRDAAVANRTMFIRNYRYLFFKNVYPYNRFKIVCYWWSLLGLFVQAVLQRDRASLIGYTRFLLNIILSKN